MRIKSILNLNKINFSLNVKNSLFASSQEKFLLSKIDKIVLFNNTKTNIDFLEALRLDRVHGTLGRLSHFRYQKPLKRFSITEKTYLNKQSVVGFRIADKKLLNKFNYFLDRWRPSGKRGSKKKDYF